MVLQIVASQIFLVDVMLPCYHCKNFNQAHTKQISKKFLRKRLRIRFILGRKIFYIRQAQPYLVLVFFFGQHTEAYIPKDKRKILRTEAWNLKRPKGIVKEQMVQDDEEFRLPNPMTGFGVPSETWNIVHRTLPEAALGPPYFYYENVAMTPRGVWSTISRFLYDIVPEFVDSKYFCAAARKRGYIHNLPIHNRFQILPPPPLKIHKTFPHTKKWWPSWDARDQLNCLLTCVGSAKLTERIRNKLEESAGEPPVHVKKYIMEQCKRWNLIWVGKNNAATIEPEEIEILMGFPVNHTRGVNRTDRFKALGNAFQVRLYGMPFICRTSFALLKLPGLDSQNKPNLKV